MNFKITCNKMALLMLFCSLQIIALAQGGIITGKITGTNNDPLPGVSILIKGTTTGTISDVEGLYSLSVPDQNAELVFSFVGYKTKEVLVSGLTIIDVLLEEDQLALDEILVIGYGRQKAIDKTGAVAQISSKDFLGGVVTDPIQSIQGKTSGVLITKKGGDPNSGFKVKIRGASGFNSNTEPLYVVDGVPGVDPTTVASEDIETFNILKDAASAAIYGSRGSNGVIIITTKKGKSGNSQVMFNAKASIDKVANKLDLLTANEIRQFAKDNNDTNFYDGGANTDWQDEIFRTGVTQEYNLSFAGGNENSTYYASLTHANWDGVMKGTSKNRTIAKVNLMHKALKDRLTLSGSLSGTFENNDYENYDGYDKDDILYQAFSRNPTDPVYDSAHNYDNTQREFNYENPLATINKIDNLRDAKRFLANFKTELVLFKDLTGTVNIGYIRDDHEKSYFRPKGLHYGDFGSASKEYENVDQRIIETYLNYFKTFNLHNLDIVGGYTWQGYTKDGFKAEGLNPQSDYLKYNNLGALIDINRNSISSWKSMWNLVGFFARAQYNYNSKYYLSGSIRTDGSSKFGVNNKWGYFPTAAIGWTLTREDFMQNIAWLNNLKLRASYGVSGNQEIGEYRSQVIFEPKDQIINPETGNPVIDFRPSHNANPNLRWEKTAETNLGVDYGMMDNKVSGSLELYYKKTEDLLGEYEVPVPPNLARTTFANSGSLENKGVELSIQYFVINRGNFKWKTTLNTSHNKSKYIDLGEYAPEDGSPRKEGKLTGRGLIGEENYVTGIQVGHSPGAFYLPVYLGLTSDGKMAFKSETGGATDDLTKVKREFVGDPNPDVEFGWTNNFTFYKNWSVDFSFRALIGNDVFNATAMFFDYPGNLPSLNGSTEAIGWYNKGRETGPIVADIYVENASFLRLDFLSLAYNFNTSKLGGITNLKVYTAINNLFTLTNYSGVDPETTVDGLSFGIDQYNVYPKTRTFSIGINASF